MPRAKAPYKGDDTGQLLEGVSPELRTILRNHYLEEKLDPEEAPYHGDPEDVFIESILVEVRFAISELHAYTYDITKEELLAEHKNIVKVLKTTQRDKKSFYKVLESLQYKLKSLSPDLNRLIDTDPLAITDEIEKILLDRATDPSLCQEKIRGLIDSLKATKLKINRLSVMPRLVAKRHAVAVEMTIRILRILKSYKIKTSSHCDTTFDYASKAVLILKDIGDDIGLVIEKITWRDIIQEAKSVTPDI